MILLLFFFGSVIKDVKYSIKSLKSKISSDKILTINYADFEAQYYHSHFTFSPIRSHSHLFILFIVDNDNPLLFS